MSAGDLIAFITARLDEDERYLNANRRHLWTGRPLREVEAKRAILAEHAAVTGITSFPLCRRCGRDDHMEPFPYRSPCPTLRALAAVWSGHPDYCPEWAPPALSGDAGALNVAPEREGRALCLVNAVRRLIPCFLPGLPVRALRPFRPAKTPVTGCRRLSRSAGAHVPPMCPARPWPSSPTCTRRALRRLTAGRSAGRRRG